jgi:toxin FitB
VYLIDTNVISEARKGDGCNSGVRKFFADAKKQRQQFFLSAMILGELWRGVEMLESRGDSAQASRLKKWLTTQVETEYEGRVLAFTHHTARIWARLMAPDNTNAIDKQIAATALEYYLTVVTRNSAHMAPTGVRTLNPFD